MSQARERFEQVRRDVMRLHDVKLAIMCDGEDWRPPTARARRGMSNPTANAAIRNVDELEGKLRALRAEERELEESIGEALVIIRAVREGFISKYADVLEWRYIDCMTWEVIDSEYGMARTTCRRYADIAFNWIDSIGVTRILAGDLEI